MKTDIVEISGTDRVIIIHPDELSFTPALTLTDAEYQAAAERVAFAAEAMGEHVLISGTGSPLMKTIRNSIDAIYEARWGKPDGRATK